MILRPRLYYLWENQNENDFTQDDGFISSFYKNVFPNIFLKTDFLA